MTATSIPALLEPIQARLDAATPGPWKAEPYVFGVLEDGRIRVTSSSDSGIYNTAEDVLPADAVFIAAAPTDTARLLAAVKAVSDLANEWEQRGEYDMAYSKTIQDEDIAIEILKSGAQMVDDARLIRNALESALRSEA